MKTIGPVFLPLFLSVGLLSCTSAPKQSAAPAPHPSPERQLASQSPQCRTPELDRAVAVDYWEKASSQDVQARFKRWKSKEDRIYLNGIVLPGDCTRFQTLLSDQTRALVLNSVEGDVDEAVCIGKEVRDRKLQTEVQGMCLGPCFELLFLAGTKKKIRDGFVGMYASLENPRQFNAEKARASLKSQIQDQDLQIRMHMPEASDQDIQQIKDQITQKYLEEFRQGFESYVHFKESLRIPASFDNEFAGESLAANGHPVVILPSPSLLRRHQLETYEGAPNACLIQPLAGTLEFVVK